MNMRNQQVLYAASALLLALVIDVAVAANTVTINKGKWVITMTDLGVLAAGAGSEAYSINELGEIVGTATSPEGPTVRPIWKNGVLIDYLQGTGGTPYAWNSQRHAVGANVVSGRLTYHVYWLPGLSGDLPPLPGGRAYATTGVDVNAYGEMSGSSETTTPTLQTRPVTWLNGVINRDLGMPLGARSAAGSGINDQGDVVGYMTDAVTGRISAFLHSNGQYLALPSPSGASNTYAIDINNKGDILGRTQENLPIVWKRGATAPTILPIPAGRSLQELWRINDNGDVVGSITGVWPVYYSAALWRNGQLIELGGWPGTGVASHARGINNAGTIVGASDVLGMYYHAVTWQVTAKSRK